VILMYWTFDVAADGTVSFKRDVYGRDPALLKALDGDFSFRRRPVAGRTRI
jgi:murein L,D-transpeptidase YcbB/YkuD